jgi:hypothetical protein
LTLKDAWNVACNWRLEWPLDLPLGLLPQEAVDRLNDRALCRESVELRVDRIELNVDRHHFRVDFLFGTPPPPPLLLLPPLLLALPLLMNNTVVHSCRDLVSKGFVLIDEQSIESWTCVR